MKEFFQDIAQTLYDMDRLQKAIKKDTFKPNDEEKNNIDRIYRHCAYGITKMFVKYVKDKNEDPQHDITISYIAEPPKLHTDIKITYKAKQQLIIFNYSDVQFGVLLDEPALKELGVALRQVDNPPPKSMDSNVKAINRKEFNKTLSRYADNRDFTEFVHFTSKLIDGIYKLHKSYATIYETSMHYLKKQKELENMSKNIQDASKTIATLILSFFKSFVKTSGDLSLETDIVLHFPLEHKNFLARIIYLSGDHKMFLQYPVNHPGDSQLTPKEYLEEKTPIYLEHKNRTPWDTGTVPF